jgi:acyl-CoA synthetase (AMP-forming)/AMP-acid ligase II
VSYRRKLEFDTQNQTKGLFAWLADEASSYGDREALLSPDSKSLTTVSVAQLCSKSLSLATGLRSMGIGQGNTIGIWLPNQIEWMVAQFACSAIGTTALGLNTRYRSHELTHILATIPLTAIVVPSEFMGIDFMGTLKTVLDSRLEMDRSFEAPKIIFTGEIPPGARDIPADSYRYQDLVSKPELEHWKDHPEQLSNLFTTSGSTSAPKLAGHDQASMVRHARAGALALGVRTSDRLLATLPLCGVFGLNSVMAILSGGGSALLLQSFDATVAARHLSESMISHVVGGDEMLGAMFARVPEGTALPYLRRGAVANFAGRVKDVVHQAQNRWGAIISGVYGSSELLALSAIWPESADVSTRVLSGGVPVEEGIKVRVLDLETSRLCQPDEPGELQFKGYNVFKGYVSDSFATTSAFTSDGWFRTGDLGYLTCDGFVYQCRAREALRLHGFLVEPSEIEDFLSLDDSIEEVHVVGIETDTGTKAVAFALPRSGKSIDEATLLKNAQQHLASYKVPERVIEVSAFPTTAGTNGTKIRTEELRTSARMWLGQI